MMFKLPALPYTLDALEPVLSRETLDYHYNKHHQNYLNKLNELLPTSPFAAEHSLEKIIKLSYQENNKAIFNNAAQVWNHTFYWNNLTPLKQFIDFEQLTANNHAHQFKTIFYKSFTDFKIFQEKFNQVAVNTFGSGWAWLVYHINTQQLEIISTRNADNPLTAADNKIIPLLTCDVWEHAYYIDYRNARLKYLDSFWSIVNWSTVIERFIDIL